MAVVATEFDVARIGTSKENSYLKLLRVTGLLDRIMQPYFSRFGISRSQWACLRILHCVEVNGIQGLRPMDLGRRLLVRPPSITGLISRLIRLDYVTTRSSADDRRCKLICITVRGRKLVERILAVHAQQIAKVMSGLDAAEQRRLNSLLRRLAAHLESMVEKESSEPGLQKNCRIKRCQDPAHEPIGRESNLRWSPR